MKKHIYAVIATVALLTLAGCANGLTTTKTTYGRAGMVAVIKGTSSADKVTYQAKTKSGQVKTSGGTFAISVPVATTAQTVTLKAAGKTQTVTVRPVKALGAYDAIQKTYNQAVIAAALPPNAQAAVQKRRGNETASSVRTPEAVAETQRLQAAMAQAKQATASRQLPAKVTGMRQVLKTDAGTVRMNVQDGQVVGITDIVPVAVLKDKTKQQAFGMQFGLLASAVGADAKKVAKAFEKATKDAGTSSTTMDTITSNGVKFDVGYSPTALYIYITK